MLYFTQESYKKANKAVAELCNHKKTVSKNHSQAMANAHNRVNALKMKVKVLEKELVLRKKILKIKCGKLEPKQEHDLKEETEDEHQVVAEPKLKVKTEPELKVKAEPESKMKAEPGLEVKAEREKSEEGDSKGSVEREYIKKEPNVEVKEDTSNAEEEKEMVKVMRYLKKTDKRGLKDRVEECKKRLKAAFEAVEKAESDAALREEMKEIALGTSKLNYLDPRITVQWCTTHGVPLEKV